MGESKTCSIDGCPEPHYGRGYCNRHYQTIKRQIGFGQTCTIEGCESPAIAKELCSTHYARVQRRGTTELPPDTVIHVCLIEGCGKPTVGQGLCQAHYKRKRRTGGTELLRDDPKTRTHKTCNKCKEVVPLEGFHIDKTRADGRVGICKSCKTVYGPKIPPEMRTVKRCAKCRQIKPINDFANDKARRDGKTSRCIECRREDSKLFEQTHSEARQARASEWARKNPAVSRSRNYRRRARMNQAPTYFITDKDMRRVYEAPCFICGSTYRPTFDHRVPISLGGSHVIGNALTLCLSCNSKKRDRLLADFRYRP